MIARSAGSRLRVAAFLAASLVLCSCAKKDTEATDAEVPPVVGVRTALVTRRAVRETVSGIGTITTRPDHMAQMSAPALTRCPTVT